MASRTLVVIDRTCQTLANSWLPACACARPDGRASKHPLVVVGPSDISLGWGLIKWYFSFLLMFLVCLVTDLNFSGTAYAIWPYVTL